MIQLDPKMGADVLAFRRYEMSEELVKIEASPREVKGKSHIRKLRRSGRIPGVLLDKGQSIMLEFDPKWLGKAYKNGKQFELTFNGQTRVVKVVELQLDPVKRVPLHVDLMYA
jgi:ribosomal protein L25 (general stress protein Ctc)